MPPKLICFVTGYILFFFHCCRSCPCSEWHSACAGLMGDFVLIIGLRFGNDYFIIFFSIITDVHMYLNFDRTEVISLLFSHSIVVMKESFLNLTTDCEICQV